MQISTLFHEPIHSTLYYILLSHKEGPQEATRKLPVSPQEALKKIGLWKQIGFTYFKFQNPFFESEFTFYTIFNSRKTSKL